MDKQSIIQYQSDFDKIAHFINNDDNSEQVEVWFARELQVLLGYARWKNFLVAIHNSDAQNRIDRRAHQTVVAVGNAREIASV